MKTKLISENSLEPDWASSFSKYSIDGTVQRRVDDMENKKKKKRKFSAFKKANSKDTIDILINVAEGDNLKMIKKSDVRRIIREELLKESIFNIFKKKQKEEPQEQQPEEKNKLKDWIEYVKFRVPTKSVLEHGESDQGIDWFLGHLRWIEKLNKLREAQNLNTYDVGPYISRLKYEDIKEIHDFARRWDPASVFSKYLKTRASYFDNPKMPSFKECQDSRNKDYERFQRICTRLEELYKKFSLEFDKIYERGEKARQLYWALCRQNEKGIRSDETFINSLNNQQYRDWAGEWADAASDFAWTLRRYKKEIEEYVNLSF